MLQSSATYQDGREAKVSQRYANDRPAHSPAHQTTRVTSRWFPSVLFPRMFRQLFKRKDLFQCWMLSLKVFVDDVKSIPWISRWPGFLIFVSGVELAPEHHKEKQRAGKTVFTRNMLRSLVPQEGFEPPTPSLRIVCPQVTHLDFNEPRLPCRSPKMSLCYHHVITC